MLEVVDFGEDTVNKGLMVAGADNDEYETPGWLFTALDREFGFDTDGAATEGNRKRRRYWSVEESALTRVWSGRVFCNPPYSKVDAFVESAMLSWGRTRGLGWSSPEHLGCVVMLLPVRTDTGWWGQLEGARGVEKRYFRRRVSFELGGEPQKSPRFATMVAIWR